MNVTASHIAKYVQAKVHNAVEASKRPAAVTEAQHKHLKAFPACAACGATEECQAHHIVPYNTDPSKGADPNNFITLCEHIDGDHHHLGLGHGGFFQADNLNVVADTHAYAHAKTDAERKAILAKAEASRVPNKPAA